MAGLVPDMTVLSFIGFSPKPATSSEPLIPAKAGIQTGIAPGSPLSRGRAGKEALVSIYIHCALENADCFAPLTEIE
jgi:hypothetical protein